MATLAELYEFLETKQDDSHLDSRFSYDAFLPVEQPKARLEILTWWKIERLIEDENCNFDKNFIVSYFDERVKATNNQLLKYRYKADIYKLFIKSSYDKEVKEKNVSLSAQHSFEESVRLLERVALGLSLMNAQSLNKE